MKALPLVWIWILAGILLALSACTQAGITSSPTPSALPAELFTQVVQTLTAAAPGSTPLPPAASPTRPAPTSTETAAPAATPTPSAAEAAPPPAQTVPAPSATPPPAETVPAPTATPLPTETLPAQMATALLVTPSAGPGQAAACEDKAAYYGDVTIPDDTLLAMNKDFVKTWKIRNAGTCSWGEGYQLVFAGGSPLNGPQGQPLPAAGPGEIIQVSVSLRTPAQGGTYYSEWVFQNPAGKRFGVNSGGIDKIWTKIKVDWGPGVGPTATPPPVNCAYTPNPAYASQLLELINGARAAEGLKPLALQNQLSAAAQAHSADMACNNFMDHTGSDKSNWFTRIKAAGYSYSYASENVFSASPQSGGDAAGAFKWWMGSPVHRANILSSQVTQIGIGYAFYAQSKNGGYYTLNFARP